MKSDHFYKKNTQILRDTSIHSRPHVLGHSRSIQEEIPSIPLREKEDIYEEIQQKALEILVEPAAPIPVIDRFSEGYQKGLAEGKDLGFSEAQKIAEDKYQSEKNKIFSDAQNEGFSQGLIKAQMKNEAELDLAIKDAQQVLQNKIKKLDQMLDSIPVELSKHRETFEDEIVDLSFAVICKILGEHAATKNGLLSIINKHIRHFPQDPLQIGMQSEDLLLLETELAQLNEDGDPDLIRFKNNQRIQLFVDTENNMGGIVLRSKKKNLNARLEDQINLLKDTLLAVRAQKTT